MNQTLSGLIAVLLLLGAAAANAQSCTAIGSSTFCGPRGSHNTVGRTMIFNNGPAGQRVGDYAVTGTPPRTSRIVGMPARELGPPRSFSSVGVPRGRLTPGPRRSYFGSGELYDSTIARLRAEIINIEARYQLEQLELTPAQESAKDDMPPALLRALTLAKRAREKAEAEADAPATPQ
ncbi:MAG: hypothetical protein ACFCUT_10220 [Kiloniellaceae bacterium]